MVFDSSQEKYNIVNSVSTQRYKVNQIIQNENTCFTSEGILVCIQHVGIKLQSSNHQTA